MSRPTIAARSIGSPIADLIQHAGQGTLAATFTRSCYLDLNGRIVALVAPDLLNGPLNVVLSPAAGFSFDRLPVGTPVHSAQSTLSIGDAAVVDLSRAVVWNARLEPLPPHPLRPVQADLDVIKRVLAAAPRESLAHTTGRPPRAVDGMDALYSGLRSADAGALAFGAGRLVGLGAGLTPSGDDVLTGGLVAVALLRPPGARSIRDAILSAARDRTTRISLAYLEAAASGDAGEAWHLLGRAMSGADGDAVTAAAQRVMAFGETSGADLLTGFVLAGEALGAR